MVQGVANRDIKLENTLLLQGSPPVIKLCDFGYSKASPLHAQLLAWPCASLACLLQLHAGSVHLLSAAQASTAGPEC